MRKHFKKLLQIVEDILLTVRVVRKARTYQTPKVEITGFCLPIETDLR